MNSIYVLIITNCLDTEHEWVCLFTLYRVVFPWDWDVIEDHQPKGLPRPGLLLSVYRVSVLQGSYCFRDRLCSMLTHKLSISDCILKMPERADILSYIFPVIQTMQRGSDCGLFCLRTRVVCLFPLLIWVLKKQRHDSVVCLVKV